MNCPALHRSFLQLAVGLASLLLVDLHAQADEQSAPWTDIVRIDPSFPHHFTREDGSHFYLFNTTSWLYFAAKDPSVALARANRLGATVMRVHLEGNSYFPEVGLDAWPWGGTRADPDFDSFNEPYWDEVDRRIELAAEHGIGFDLTLFKSLKLPDTPESFELVRPYLERVIDRLARHPNIFCWEVHNEHIANPRFQEAVGRYLQANDPYGRPVISSDGTTDYPLWPHADWMDMALVHHCTGNQPRYDLRDWYLAIARNIRVFGKPAFNNETGREVRHSNDDPDHRRKQLWIAAAAGGYTTWHTWGGCEGIDDPAYRAPGERYVRPFVDWWSTQEYWRVDPVLTTAQLPADDPRREDLIPVALSSASRDLTLVYLFTRSAGTEVANAELRLRLPDGVYGIEFFRPADGTKVGTATAESKGLRGQVPVVLPVFTDDLALRIVNVEDREKSLIEGTL